MVLHYDPKQCLPSSAELPDSDDTPVDNVDRRASRSVLQNLIPNLLEAILAMRGPEDNIPPVLALEVVSKTYGGEYERKKDIYADLGTRYYAVYLPNQRSRRKRQPLEVYGLANGRYQLLEGNPVWLPEIGLGLGRDRGTYLGREREWLYWYNEAGDRLPTPEERIQQEQARAI